VSVPHGEQERPVHVHHDRLGRDVDRHGPERDGGGRRALQTFFVDAQHGWVYGDGGRIQATLDGGATWTTQTTGTTGTIRALDFVDAQHGWALVYSIVDDDDLHQVLRTSDGGATWTSMTVPMPQFATVNGLTFRDASHGWLVGDVYEGFEARPLVLASDDGGVSFHETYRGDFYDAIGLADVTAVGASTLLAVGYRNTYPGPNHELILRSVDDGATWSTLPSGTNDSCLRVVEFADPLHGWAAGCAGGIVGTSDGGASWSVQRAVRADALPPDADVVSLHMVDSNVGFAGDDDGKILLTTTSGQ
jgi:photosystem II stability/assembly factor-like uncharacterized protein